MEMSTTAKRHHNVQRLHLFVLAALVVVIIIVILATALPRTQQTEHSKLVILPERLDSALCPAEYGSTRPVILVSLDGFIPDYLQKNLTPTLQVLGNKGVRTPYMLPIYPTKTFPNHYSIVTGLYPESHGIVDNVFFDTTFASLFTIKSPAVANGSWWWGEPVWNTLARHGKKSATYYWPGSEADVGGIRPTHWFPYNGSVPYGERVEKVLEWVTLPQEDRPSLVSLYLDQPDSQAHATGPFSPEVDEQLERVEATVRELVQGLASKGLLHCVNLMLVSDHGMVQAKEDAVLDLARSVPDISDKADVIFGASPKVIPKDPDEEAAVELVRRLNVDFHGKMQAFLKKDLPQRIHYSHNPRIAPIVLDLTPGYTVKDARPNVKPRPPLQGFHGYDYIHTEMAAIFIGYGPDFAQGKTVEPFQNIELYNLLCVLTGVDPAPNNGTWGSLHHLLASPPAPPALPQVPGPIPLEYPGDGSATSFQLASGCTGDQTGQTEWTYKMTAEETVNSTLENLPWGAPVSDPDTLARPALLMHRGHATGYSRELRIPLWTSFTLNTYVPRRPSSIPWLADPRLPPGEGPTCEEYDTRSNLTMTSLFPPRYTPSTVPFDEAYLVSNVVGISRDGMAGADRRWMQLIHEVTPSWVAIHAPLNLVLGPVFDSDRDGHIGPLPPAGSLPVASDLYAVMTRCLDQVTSLASCAPASLDTLSFVYPLSQKSWRPSDVDHLSYALKYTARVRDVEMLTGLTFFPNLTVRDRLRLAVRSHTTLWHFNTTL